MCEIGNGLKHAHRQKTPLTTHKRVVNRWGLFRLLQLSKRYDSTATFLYSSLSFLRYFSRSVATLIPICNFDRGTATENSRKTMFYCCRLTRNSLKCKIIIWIGSVTQLIRLFLTWLRPKGTKAPTQCVICFLHGCKRKISLVMLLLRDKSRFGPTWLLYTCFVGTLLWPLSIFFRSSDWYLTIQNR